MNSSLEGIQPGSKCPLSRSYCRKIIWIGEPIAVVNAEALSWKSNPNYD